MHCIAFFDANENMAVGWNNKWKVGKRYYLALETKSQVRLTLYRLMIQNVVSFISSNERYMFL